MHPLRALRSKNGSRASPYARSKEWRALGFHILTEWQLPSKHHWLGNSE
jgi:hypothetical protein